MAPNKANILISTSSFTEYDKSVLDGLLKFNVILNPYQRTLKEAEIKELLVRYDVCGLIAGTEPLSKAVLNAANGLKVIVFQWFGLSGQPLCRRFN